MSACNLLVKLKTGTKINREIIKSMSSELNITAHQQKKGEAGDLRDR